MTSLVTADTSTAFDCVEHGRLWEKLGWYGIYERWFRAWLSGRRQAVGGGTDVPVPVTHVVVQGSILLPVLFLALTKDLPQHVPHGRLAMYADDAQFLKADSSDNLSGLKHRVENTLSEHAVKTQFSLLTLQPQPRKFHSFSFRRANPTP